MRPDIRCGCWRFELNGSCSNRHLLPRRIHRLAHQLLRIRPRLRPEFLYPPAVDFRDIEIAFLIDAEAVYAPEAAGEVAPDAPRVEKVPLEIVLQHFRCAAVGSPECA